MEARLAAARQRTRRRHLALALGGVALLIALLLPSWLKLRALQARTRAVDADIDRLEATVTQLTDEHSKLQSDPTYIERIARQEFRATRAGETLFKIEDAADGPADATLVPPTSSDPTAPRN